MSGEPHALWKFVEDAPIPAYAFRAVEGDFILESCNAEARLRNPSLVNVLGLPCSQLYGDQPEMQEAAERCMREQRTVRQRWSVRRHNQLEATQPQDLVYVWVAPDLLIVYGRDVSSPEEMAAALQESEERYRSVVTSLPEGVVLRGSDARVLTCNDAAVKLFGQRTQGDVLGHIDVLAPGYRVLTEADRPVPGEDYPSRRVLRTGARVAEELYQVCGADGTRTWVLVSAQPVFTRGGAVGGSVALYKDVTERRRLEEELRQAQRLESIGRLAGGLAHDFNNLLTAMIGSLELVGDVCPPTASEDLDTIRHAANRARELTAQLLAFARKQAISLEVVEVGALVRKVERLLQRLVGPSVELVIAAQQGAHVRADAAQLEQVLVNLVANARDAMPGGGRIDVRVATAQRADQSEWALLEVEDHGVGMAPEVLKHIFEPFFSTKVNGTGLGLASSYGVVKQHGGEIDVRSEPGRGTSVRVCLPCVPDPVSRAVNIAPVPSGHGCILLVDDDEHVRATTARLLQRMGYQVLIAADGASALELARRHVGEIDVLLCDVAMPGRSGPEVARDVLAVSPETRVLFISGYPEGAESALARHAFLQKPYTRANLGEKLDALRASRAHRDE